MEATTGATEPDQGPGPVTPFSRNATGLVRELPLVDMLTYNASAATPLAAVMALSLFSILVAFPGANLLIALPIALVGGLFLWITYSLMSAAMPRVGGTICSSRAWFTPPSVWPRTHALSVPGSRARASSRMPA